MTKEPKDRTEISVVVDGTLIDYVQKEVAYSRISDLENRVKHLQSEKMAAVDASRRAEGRFTNLVNSITRILSDISPVNNGWMASIHADDLNDVRSQLEAH